MARLAKNSLQERFFREIGPNAATFKAMFDAAPLLCFYMKDLDGRIMALNRRNCDVCNIRDEEDAIGRKSSDIFPAAYANDYHLLDLEVIRSGKPVIGRITQYPADRSMNVMVSDVYPLRNARGRIVGTARAYRLASDAEVSSLRYGSIRKVAQFVKEHYAEGLTLAKLIEVSGMTKNNLFRTFAAIFNMTPWHYLVTIRLNAARELLETTDMQLSDIAAATGFFDQSHLARVFRKERNTTPGEYRRKHRKV